MCGIFALSNHSGTSSFIDSRVSELLYHRGPDNQSLYTHSYYSILHTRLSILDPTPTSNQPFLSLDGRYVLAINGEIINFRALASTYSIPLHSDCYVFFELIQRLGLIRTLELSEGMFSGVLLDKHTNELTLFRDRFGIKPLYYSSTKDSFVACSEIYPIWEVFRPATNTRIAADFLAFGLLDHTSETFFCGINSLPAGHTLTYSPNILSPKPSRWYEPALSIPNTLITNISVAKEQLSGILSAIIHENFESDVPVGLNLSDGIDSSLLQAVSHRFGKTSHSYTLDFDLDELSPFYEFQRLESASRTTIKFDCEAFLADLKSVVLRQAQPFTGMFTPAYSQLYSRANRDGCKVLLDGNGIDEIFLGYDKYFKPDLSTMSSNIDGSSSMANHSLFTLDIQKETSQSLETSFNNSSFTPARLLGLRDLFYTKIPRVLRFNDLISMQYSCELRVPFLDHRLLEFSLSLDETLLIDQPTQLGKLLIRDYLSDFFPRQFTHSPKRYVQSNQTKLLQTQFHSLVYDTLLTPRCLNRGYYEPETLRTYVNSFMSQPITNSFLMWRLLSFEWWCQAFHD